MPLKPTRPYRGLPAEPISLPSPWNQRKQRWRPIQVTRTQAFAGPDVPRRMALIPIENLFGQTGCNAWPCHVHGHSIYSQHIGDKIFRNLKHPMNGVFPFPTKTRSTLLLARLNRGRSRSRRSAALGVLGNTDTFGMRGADEGPGVLD